jgi:hypothetical protein
MSGPIRAPGTLPARKEPMDTHWIRSWVGPTNGDNRNPILPQSSRQPSHFADEANPTSL